MNDRRQNIMKRDMKAEDESVKPRKILVGAVTPKSVPPKIGPAGPILAEKPAKTGPPGPLLLPKSVRPDRFWLPKLVPPCQNQSPMGDWFWHQFPMGDRFWQEVICQNRPPQGGTYINKYSCASMAAWMQLSQLAPAVRMRHILKLAKCSSWTDFG